MNDLGGSSSNQFTNEIKSVADEVIQDVKDQVGQAIEQGVQSIVGRQVTPQQAQQKQADTQRRLMWARKVIDYYKQTEKAVQNVREEKKQKEQQRLQTFEQKKQENKFQAEQKKKQPVNPAIAYAGKAEFKRGVGG